MGSIRTPAKNPFLNIELLVQVALDVGADAIHPGYGYLSENENFADSIRAAGIIFLGPTGVAMSTLGNKRTSKAYLHEHAPEIPLIPGFTGTSQNLDDLAEAASSIGFPVMLKASAGGGGKGMRIVRDRSQLKEELERAQSEARSSFGSDDCILEKYIEAGKHVEVQIIGDRHGKVVSLWDRDCSVQRRHQKVIEEAPCPWLSDELRERMSATARRIAELISYEGAGTVEFVVDVTSAKYYFLEVNARLQVEHPITEEITGVDLVSLQLYVASGGRLADLAPLKTVARNGHAIECRLCAEDAHRDFFPENGLIREWQPAPGNLAAGRDIRYETAIRAGSQVSIYFDSMIAKLIVWSPTRAQAIDTMLQVLANTVCSGVRTNQLFLQSCLSHPEFSNPAYTTSFIGNNMPQLLRNPHRSDAEDLYQLLGGLASLYLKHKRDNRRTGFRHVGPSFRNQKRDSREASVNFVTTMFEGSFKFKPEDLTSLVITEKMKSNPCQQNLYIGKVPQPSLSTEDEVATATMKYNAVSSAVRSGDWRSKKPQVFHLKSVKKLSEGSHGSSDVVEATIDGRKFTMILSSECRTSDDDAARAEVLVAHIPILGTWVEYNVYSALTYAESMRAAIAAVTGGGARVVKAPMPCKILRVLKKNGDKVEKGENLMVVESMKMEMSITAPDDGEFKTDRAEAEAVDDGGVLCEVV